MASLSERISNTIASDMYQRAMAMINSGPKIRAAEYLEARLQAAGLNAQAMGHVGLHNAVTISVHVVCHAAEHEVADVMMAHDIPFDRTIVRGQEAVHFDCNVGSYNIVLLVMTPQRGGMELQ